MKFLIIILLSILCFPVVAQETPVKISGDYNGVTFQDFVERIESTSGYTFYFKSGWIKDIVLQGSYKEAELPDILERELKDHSLFFVIDDAQRVFLTQGFAIKMDFSIKELNDTNFIIVEQTEQQIEEEQRSEFEVIDIGTPSDDASGQVTLSGYIKDINSGEPVIGAVIYATEINAAVTTNNYGYYSLTIPRGSYQFQFTCLGMKETSKQVNAYGSGNLNVEMSVRMIPLKGVTVTANTDVALTRMEVGLEKLSMQTISLLPTNMGEPDIISSVWWHRYQSKADKDGEGRKYIVSL